MISVAEAEKIIARHARSWGTEQVPLEQSWGCILREDLRADRDFPPFDRVTMDGIAIRFERFAAGQRRFPVAGVQAAGAAPLPLADPAHCLEVMTGAMLPEGADTVIRYEDLRLENGEAEILVEGIHFRQNLHFQGMDRRQGELLVPAGRQIAAPEIATAATIGKSSLLVARRPRIAIVSTGDELVGVGETPLPHQIRRSNAYALQAMLAEKFQLAGHLFHFADDKLQIADGLRDILARFDLVVLSGAVSAGKFDFVPEVLDELGVEKCFHQVAQRPGKPFWFGHFQQQAVVFALPGNPVSTFLCAWRYLVPFLRQSMGQEEQAPLLAVLSEDVVFKPPLSYFLPVKLSTTPTGIRLATPVPGHGSGDLANLNDADGFLELPKGQDVYPAGTAFPLIPYR
ncbi:MAG: molybdopterin molybdotransferase MoeA [Saprospiraceae bacterium]|nr:molybdopterin molybdotransferase MoeA [Saprospiraceae bacterium]